MVRRAYQGTTRTLRAVQLENQGYVCYLPTLTVGKICRGKKTSSVEPLFTRYLFIRLNPCCEVWAPVQSTRGVSGLLKFGERLATLPDTCIKALRAAPRRTARSP